MATPATRGGTNNTAFSPNPDKVAQISGSGQPVPGSVQPTYTSGGSTALDSILQYSTFVNVVTSGGNTTLTTGTIPYAGGRVAIQLTNDASSNRTITFGTGFRSTGTVVGNTSKIVLVDFVSDGTTLNEIARSVSAIT